MSKHFLFWLLLCFPSIALAGNGTSNPNNVNGSIHGSGGPMAIGATITGATAGSIPYVGTAGVLAQDNANFNWNDSTQVLTVGTPVFTTGIASSQFTGSVAGGTYQMVMQNSNSAAGSSTDFIAGGSDMTNTAHYLDMGKNGPNGGAQPFPTADDSYQYTVDANMWFGAYTQIGFAVGTGIATATPSTDLSITATAVTLGVPLQFPAARYGTFVCTGAGTITITNSNMLATSNVVISMNAAGGTITTPPAMKTVTGGTGFTVLCGVTDTSTYNYLIMN